MNLQKCAYAKLMLQKTTQTDGPPEMYICEAEANMFISFTKTWSIFIFKTCRYDIMALSNVNLHDKQLHNGKD